MVSGSSGHDGVTAAYPASSNNCVQRSQLLGSSQSPWMNTTGVRPLAFACSTCSVSGWVMVAMCPVSPVSGSRRGSLRPRYCSGPMDVHLTHIGGPTVLIEVAGWRLLTDPTFDPSGGSYRF